jgi:integrase/recombinase XerD
MKKLPLENQSYAYLQSTFSDWLEALGYAKPTVYHAPIYIREFLFYLESKNVQNIKRVDSNHLAHYISHLENRTNQTQKSGTLSNNSLRKRTQALKLFLKYIRQAGDIMLPPLEVDARKADTAAIEVLSKTEVKQLFEATYINSGKIQHHHILLRDRALLTVIYCCGLRRNEAIHLDLKDIDFENSVVKVTKGKAYKQRFVPLHRDNLIHLDQYVRNSRSRLLKHQEHPAFFANFQAGRLKGSGMLERIKVTQQKSDSQELRNKKIGLHTFRHSIATHLLESGMELEMIARFLGHSSLDSTQIYTHLLEQK